MSGRRWLLGVLGTVVILSVSADMSAARTWYLEKDGSGDFAVIQEAVDAAASGDTLRIGPGRWYEHWVILYGEVYYTLVEDKSLTFIGSGQTTTIIGHETSPFSSSTTGYSFVFIGDIGTTRFEDIGFDIPGFHGNAIWHEGSRLEVENCRFTRLSRGIFTTCIGGGFVRNCEFLNVNYNNGGQGIAAYTPARDLMIEDCTFTNCSTAFRADWGGCQDITVQNCVMTGGRTGVGFISGASGTVRNCSITGQNQWGILGNHFGSIVIEDSYISTSSTSNAVAFGIGEAYFGTVVMYNNIFESNHYVIWINSPRFTLDCHGNHFLQYDGQGWFAWAATNYTGDPLHLDLTGNWWGTDDAAYVADHIWDANDDPQVHIFFDYVPMAGGPVPVEPKTWSEVKGLFRE